VLFGSWSRDGESRLEIMETRLIGRAVVFPIFGHFFDVSASTSPWLEEVPRIHASLLSAF
jgi:hypothetical protein